MVPHTGSTALGSSESCILRPSQSQRAKVEETSFRHTELWRILAVNVLPRNEAFNITFHIITEDSFLPL